MAVKFFFDNGIAPGIAHALREAGKNVEHLQDVFPPDTLDTEWLNYLCEGGIALITKDQYIRRRPNEKALLLKYRIVAFYLLGSEKSGWDILKQLVNAWGQMEAAAERDFKRWRACAYQVRMRGGKLIDLPLT